MTRFLLLAPVGLVLAGAAYGAKDDRITASPTLPKTAAEKVVGEEQTHGATPELQPGQVLYSSEGSATARIAEIVRDKEGKPLRVILTTPDGVRRYTPVADLSRVRGRVQADLSRAQILVLPKVEAE